MKLIVLVKILWLIIKKNDPKSKYKDIVSFSYGYHPKYKYIIEFQIGHPFAFYVFTRDSYLRDNKNSDLVDLWDNNFYQKVKNKLLGNNTDVDLLTELKNLHGDKPIDPKLYEIIEKIEKI